MYLSSKREIFSFLLYHGDVGMENRLCWFMFVGEMGMVVCFAGTVKSGAERLGLGRGREDERNGSYNVIISVSVIHSSPTS